MKIKEKIYQLMNNPTWRYSKTFSALKYNSLKYRSHESILDLVMEFVKFSGLEGDYLEFGVWGGTSFSASYHLAKKWGLDSMNFYAFDSFEGLPKITGIDSKGFQQFGEGAFSCSLEDFKKNLKNKRVNLEKVQTIKGWYNKILNNSLKKKLKIKKASVIYVDCDLYESAKDVLHFITDYIQDGTVLIFDDWFCFRGNPNKGEQKAFREWLKRNPSLIATEFYKFGVHGNSFIINKNEKRI